MPRTKKTPTSQSLAARATKGPKETPKGSGPSVAPSLEARVAALEKALSVVLVHLPAAFLDAQDAANAKTRKVLEDLENRLAAGATLARVLLPEEAHDEAFEAWEALPKAAPARWKAANERLGERFVELGIVGADEVRS